MQATSILPTFRTDSRNGRRSPSSIPRAISFLATSLLLLLFAIPTAWAQDADPSADPYRRIDQLADQARLQHLLIKKVVKTVGDSVVHIEAKKRQPSSKSSSVNHPSSYVEEAGAGIVVQHRGRNYIVTNYHVIESSTPADIRVESKGYWFQPTRVVHDPQTDLSVLFVDQNDLTPARLGSSRSLEIGEFVVAIGSPFGLSHSVSYGIVSALGRRDLELGPQGVRFQDFIQTDAAINPGNSGGPLINLHGQVIGINTAIASNSGGSDGIGFSIPIDMVMRIATDLIDYGKVQRGFLGVSLDARFTPQKAISMGLNQAYGARVSAISPNSPAAQADLQIGDVILQFNGKQIVNDSHLVTEVSLTPIGDEVTLVVARRGQKKTVRVRIADRSEFGSR